MTESREAGQGNSQAPEQAHLSRLIKQLGNRDRTRREEAERALHSLGPAAVPVLLAAVANAARWRRRWQIFVVVVIGLSTASKVHKYLRRGLDFDDFVSFLSTFICCFISLPGASARQRSLIQVLSGIDDRRAIGPFTEALGFSPLSDSKARSLAREALIRLLPQLQASDGALLSDQQRANLHRALRGKDSTLTLAILKGFERVGDARDLASVEEIDSPDPEVMEAAQACLPYLREHIQQQQTRQTLLRASGPVSLTPDILLRPARGNELTETQTLLRAGSNSTEDTA